jgi:hypothetical protein
VFRFYHDRFLQTISRISISIFNVFLQLLIHNLYFSPFFCYITNANRPDPRGAKRGHYRPRRRLRQGDAMRILSIMSLWLLAACNGGRNDTDTNNGCDEVEQANNECGTDDSGTEPSAMGSFTAPPVDFLGDEEACTSNLTATGASYSVPSGETEEVQATEYIVSFGDTSKASSASANLPVHTSPDGTMGITPPVTVTVKDGEVATVETPSMNLYVEGTWTCNLVDSDESTAQTATISYPTGDSVKLPIGTLGIKEMNLEYSDDECDDFGEFLTPSQATITIDCSFQYLEMECWKGMFEERPDTW